MFTTTWNPLEELTALHRDMDRAFGRRFWDSPSYQGRRDQTWTPPLEVVSGQEAWHVRVALPGIDAKALRIDLQGNSLTIAGERPAATEPEGSVAALGVSLRTVRADASAAHEHRWQPGGGDLSRRDPRADPADRRERESRGGSRSEAMSSQCGSWPEPAAPRVAGSRVHVSTHRAIAQ